MDALKNQCAKLKLKKCKWFQYRCDFLGMGVAAGVTQPAHYRNNTFDKLERPNTWGDMRILIGIFGLYILYFSYKSWTYEPG